MNKSLVRLFVLTLIAYTAFSISLQETHDIEH